MIYNDFYEKEFESLIALIYNDYYEKEQFYSKALN